MKSIELREVSVKRTSMMPGELEAPTHLSVSIAYNDGHFGHYARGYYLEVRPQIHDGNFVTTVIGRSVAHTLHKHLLEEAGRFSKNKLVKLAASDTIKAEASKLVEVALRHNGLEALEQAKAA